MCLLDSRRLRKYPAPLLAAAALFMSKKILRVSPSWPETLRITPYNPANLKACAKELVSCGLLYVLILVTCHVLV